MLVTEPHAVAELDGRDRSAVIWDIRIAASHRRRGVGKALLEDAAPGEAMLIWTKSL